MSIPGAKFSPRVAAIGGGALAAVVAGAAILMLSGGGGSDDPGATANNDPTARPDASATSGPSATPGEPSPSPFVTVPYNPASRVFPASFDDGIDPEDLPPLAERPGPSYPPAHVMQPWVWDHVGPGWGVAVFNQGYEDELGLAPGPLMLYLLSPEGIFFEVRELAEYVSYGGTVTEVRLESRTSVIWVSEEGGAHYEDIDLMTGELLASYGFVEEGGGGETEDSKLGTFTGGRELWVHEGYDPEGPGHWLSDYSIIAPGSPAQAVVLPSRQFFFLGAADDRTAILVDGAATHPDPGVDRYVAQGLDVSSGIASTVTALFTPGLDCSAWPEYLVGFTSAVACPDGDYPDGDYTWRVFAITWDGVTPAREVDYDPWFIQAASEYEAAGFSLTFDPDSRRLTTISDASAGGNALVFRFPEPAAYYQHESPAGPIEVAPGRFVFRTGYDAVGYNRASGDVFELTGVLIPDTGVPSALNSYLPFGPLDE